MLFNTLLLLQTGNATDFGDANSSKIYMAGGASNGMA